MTSYVVAHLKIRRTIDETPVSYTHLDVYKRQAFGREKSPVCEDDLVRLQELLTKQGFVDAFSIKPDGHPVKLRFVFHGRCPPFSACLAVPPNRRSGHL